MHRWWHFLHLILSNDHTLRPILFNNLMSTTISYTPRTGKFRIPYLGVYVFKYTIESVSAHISGFLVVDGVHKLTFESENGNSEIHCDRVLTGDAFY